MAYAATPLDERIYARIRVHPLGCWEWQGAINHGGYGIVQLGRGKGTDRVHRVMYREWVGPIPESGTIDHLCANPRCCNPAHLEQVTRSENAKRQWRDGRSDPGRKQRAKTHCPQGHPYAGENLFVNKRGSRVCLTCRREQKRARRAGKAA